MDDNIKNLFEVNSGQIPSSVPLFPLDNVLLLPFWQIALKLI